jgi:serine/threonine protein kinase
MTARGSDETQDSEAPSEAESARPAARTVAGLPAKYEDLGPIAGGAFGEVRRARDLVLDRVVAMKLLRAEHAARPPLRRRSWSKRRSPRSSSTRGSSRSTSAESSAMGGCGTR